MRGERSDDGVLRRHIGGAKELLMSELTSTMHFLLANVTKDEQEASKGSNKASNASKLKKISRRSVLTDSGTTTTTFKTAAQIVQRKARRAYAIAVTPVCVFTLNHHHFNSG